MASSVKTIANFADHKLKKFEKEIRRYFKSISKMHFILEEGGQPVESNSFHAYMFKNTVDSIYKDSKEKRFPFHMLLTYAQIFTLRNLKTNCFESPFEDDYHTFLDMLNYDFITLSVYDNKFLHNPKKSYWDIACAANKTKKTIVPIQFSKDLSGLYPNWFEEGDLVVHNKIEVGVDLNLINKIKEVMK